MGIGCQKWIADRWSIYKNTTGMIKCKKLVWGLFIMLTVFGSSEAQSKFLQLNLLLEDQEQFEWTKNYPIWLAEDIPAQILVGKLEEVGCVAVGSVVRSPYGRNPSQPVALRGSRASALHCHRHSRIPSHAEGR